MAQNTNLNIAPYFDDFDANKGFLKVLFKPGYPVQARELTTLQSVLQNQIDDWNQQISDLDDPEKAELILRKRGYGEQGEVLYRFEVPEPVTPIEETLKSDRGKSLIEYVIDYVVGKEGE